MKAKIQKYKDGTLIFTESYPGVGISLKKRELEEEIEVESTQEEIVEVNKSNNRKRLIQEKIKAHRA